MRRGLWPWLLVAAGCIHYDRDDGAPGFVTLARPPEVPALRAVEPPAEPGEDLRVMSPAVLGLLGTRGLGVDARAGHGLGAELSWEWGHLDWNHAPTPGRRDGLRLPSRAWGVALGAELYLRGPLAGPISLELRRRFAPFLLAGVGPLFQPSGQRPGAVAAVMAGPLALRSGWVRGEGAFVCGGLHLSFPVAWVRSR